MRYHFIGIGGIGMSALARILRSRGAHVQGTDLVMSYVTEGLKKTGTDVFDSHDASYLQKATTVVYGTEIKPHHPEYEAAVSQGIPLLHRSELLAELMKGSRPLLIAGTHGKTSTSALLAHVLYQAELDPTFAIGGIALNYSTNGRLGKGSFFVAEADESDGTFLRYQGFGAIITNIEEEHLDFWKSRDALIQGFKTFASQISNHLWWCQDDPLLKGLNLPGKSYGFSPAADVQIARWKQEGWHLIFDLRWEGKDYLNIHLPLLGEHNVLNGAAVFALALQLGISEEVIRSALQTFQGVKRRMEKKGENRGVAIFDDYAHHPTEIKTTLEGLRKAACERRVIAVFQPHRFSRLKHCWDDFLKAFDAADVVFVSDVHGAWEKPIENITGKRFSEALKNTLPIPVVYAPRHELLHALGDYVRPHEIVVTLGAGDVTALGSELLSYPIKPFQMTILQGGKSAEHEVSLLSTRVLTEEINPQFYQLTKWTISKEGAWICEGKEHPLPDVVSQLLTSDLVLPMLHGPFGEDGMVQGFLETLGIPYVGCDFRSCVIAMDKAWTKHIALAHGVPVARFIEFSVHEWLKKTDRVRETILNSFSFPFYIKAVHLGSTFGVHRVKTEREIDDAIHAIAKLDYRFLVEEEVVGRELEFGFIGDDEVSVSDPAEVIRADEVHTYENKYALSGNPSIPKTPLPPNILEQGRRMAETVYRAVGCSGLARIDFFLKPDGTWVLSEVNPMPGFTPMSVYPVIWKAEGIPTTLVIDRVVIASLHRHRFHQRHLRLPAKPPIEL